MLYRHVLVALLLTFALSYGAEAATWARVDSPHFSVVGDVSERELRDVALKFEQFREAIGQLVPGAELVDPAPVVVIVFGSRRDYQEFVWQQPGQKVQASGQFMSGTDVIYITMSLSQESQAFRVVFHEYTHLLESNTLSTFPFWMQEGLAEYYSTFKALDSGRQAEIGQQIPEHIDLLRRDWIPLQELVSADRDDIFKRSGETHALFYAESWALTHYLTIGSPTRREQLLRVLARSADGVPAEQAFADVFGTDLTALDRELSKYIGQTRFPFHKFPLTKPVTTTASWAAQQLSAADANALLGDLLLHQERLEEAASRLKLALAQNPTHARATASLGRVRHLQGDRTEGLALMEKAAGGATDYLPLLYLADTMADASAGAPQELAKILRRAIGMQPNVAHVWFLLGQTQLRDGKAADAHRSFLRAHQLAPKPEYHDAMTRAAELTRPPKPPSF